MNPFSHVNNYVVKLTKLISFFVNIDINFTLSTSY